MMMPEELKTPQAKETLAQKLMLQYYKAYSSRDVSQITALFTKDAEIWGTAQDEHRKGIDEIVAQHLRDWSQSGAWLYRGSNLGK